MRADRLLSIMLLLQSHRKMTTGQLAERLEVSPRTIHRDMDALSAAGVPIAGRRGQGGGWELLGSYRTDLTGLTPEESQTIFLDGTPPSFSELGLNEAARSARIKLLAALSAHARSNVEYTRARLYIDPTGWSQSSDSIEFLPIIQEAIWMDRVIELTYRRADGKTVERKVHPLGLVAKGQTWYLVGAVEEGLRTYRVSRVVTAGMTGEPAVRPEGFDLRAYWEESTTDFQTKLPRYVVTLEVGPKLLNRLRFGIGFARIEHTGEPDAHGWARVTVNFGVPDEACAFVFRSPEDVRIIEPAELRDLVAARARAALTPSPSPNPGRGEKSGTKQA